MLQKSSRSYPERVYGASSSQRRSFSRRKRPALRDADGYNATQSLTTQHSTLLRDERRSAAYSDGYNATQSATMRRRATHRDTDSRNATPVATMRRGRLRRAVATILCYAEGYYATQTGTTRHRRIQRDAEGCYATALRSRSGPRLRPDGRRSRTSRGRLAALRTCTVRSAPRSTWPARPAPGALTRCAGRWRDRPAGLVGRERTRRRGKPSPGPARRA